MLLVLVILVLMAGLVWPSLDAAFAHYELRQAADLLRVNLTAARIHAIDEGVVYQFRFQPGDGSFSVAPTNQSGGSFGQTSTSGTLTPSWIVEDMLPGNASFTRESVVSVAESGVNESTSPSDANATHALFFYPDGTTDDAVLVLTNGRGATIDVSLRGLTGIVSVSDLQGLSDIR